MTVFEKWVVWVSSVVVTLSGVIYWWMKYLLPFPDAFSVVYHPLQPLVLKLHIVIAPLLVFGLGSVTIRHAWRHFCLGTATGRRSGLATLWILGPMILSGYLIQAVTGDRWVRAMVIVHIAGGSLYAIGLGIHQVIMHSGVRDQLDSGPRDPEVSEESHRAYRETGDMKYSGTESTLGKK